MMKVMWMMTFLVSFFFLFGFTVGPWDGIDGEGVLYFSAWEDEFDFEVVQISTCCSGGYTFSRSGFHACRNRSILNFFFFNKKKTVRENIESDAKIVRRPSRLVVMTRAKSDSTTSTQQHQPMTTTPQAGPTTDAIMSSALTGGNAPMVTTTHEKTGASVFL